MRAIRRKALSVARARCASFGLASRHGFREAAGQAIVRRRPAAGSVTAVAATARSAERRRRALRDRPMDERVGVRAGERGGRYGGVRGAVRAAW